MCVPTTITVEVKKEKLPEMNPPAVKEQDTQESCSGYDEEWWTNNMDEIINVCKAYD